MKLQNQYNTPSLDRPKWEKTPDGFLRCKARVLAERIMPYQKGELGELPQGWNADSVNMFVPSTQIADPASIRSLEGAPIVIGDHKWLSPEIIRDYGMGSVAGTPYMDGEYLCCDLMITNPEGIKFVEESGGYPEISAAYLADTVFEPGEYNGKPYDARQEQLVYNHIAVIPVGQGRAGRDVRILNAKPKHEEDKMAEKQWVQIRLSNGRFVNTDEEGAKAVSETEEKGTADLNKTMSELEAKNGEMQALQAEVEELKGELSVYKEKLDQLLSTEAVEHAAQEMVAEQGEAEEIIENAMFANEKEKDDDFFKRKEEVKNSLKSVHGPRLHQAVLNAIGAQTEGWSPEAMKGAFKAHRQTLANMKPGMRKVAGTQLMNGMAPTEKQKVNNNGGVQRTATQRLGFAK